MFCSLFIQGVAVLFKQPVRDGNQTRWWLAVHFGDKVKSVRPSPGCADHAPSKTLSGDGDR